MTRTPPTASDPHAAAIAAAMQNTFGLETLRPLQRDAIDAALARRDALVVMPTGGGKSLCFQLPPLVTGKLTVVVSPLIALMQDQVDGLRLLGYPAAASHSNLDAEGRQGLQRLANSGELRLVFVAPERLFLDSFQRWLGERDIGAFAIDEAHCISQWGHDFRPEYRRLAELRDRFPQVPFHAYTATATPRVREDIATQLRLREPKILVGTFDRPNLTYRVLPRVDLEHQVVEAVRRHPDAAAIIYCISRKDTESLASSLRRAGIQAAPYHAGLPADTRTQVSADFRAERLPVVVATVAFGMGIDRGDVRLVVHAAMPKSLEHYQQETGRAGRDGLPAECLLLYSAADGAKWRSIVERAASEGEGTPETTAAQLQLLTQMQRFANRAGCRHRALSEHFGQDYPHPNCGACDFCLEELQPVDDAHIIAQKILSAVARTGQRYGSSYVIDVLRGSKNQKVLERGHDKLPTFGLLANVPVPRIGNYIDQLVDAGDLLRSDGEYPILLLSAGSAQILRSERQASLVAPKTVIAAPRRQRGTRERNSNTETLDQSDLSADEQGLFNELRGLRRELASKLGVPPYVVFSDVTLVELARLRPSSRLAMLQVRGVGQKKIETFGERFLAAIASYAERVHLELDPTSGPARRTAPIAAPEDRDRADTSAAKARREELFRRGLAIEVIAAELGRAPSTVWSYLAEFVRSARPTSIRPWISAADEERVTAQLHLAEGGRMKPVFDALGGTVGYDSIRIIAAFAAARSGLEQSGPEADED